MARPIESIDEAEEKLPGADNDAVEFGRPEAVEICRIEVSELRARLFRGRGAEK